jgi:RNA-binding protein YhbY
MENSQCPNEPKLQDVISKIEQEGLIKIQHLKDEKALTIESLTEILLEGEREFIQKMGRKMTYSEMRQAYG